MGKGLTQGHLGVYLGYSALQVGFLPIHIGPTPITSVEMPGIEPGASYMQSMRSTTELHPQRKIMLSICIQVHIHTTIQYML